MAITSDQAVTTQNNPEPTSEIIDISKEQAILNNLVKGVEYYKARTNTQLKIIIFQTVLSLILAGVIIAMLLNRPSPVYFAQQSDLTITPLIPLNEPYISDAGVAQWAADCTRKTFSLDFTHLKEDLMSTKVCYQKKAFDEVLSVMDREGIFDLIKQEHLNTEMTVTTPAVVTKRGVVNGVMAWIIEFKFILSFLSSQGLANTQHLIAQTVVQRADTREYQQGVVIRQIIVKPE